MKTYLEISISAPPQQQELLIPTMVELGCHGFTDNEHELLCYMDKSKLDEKKFEQLKKDIKILLQTVSSNFDIKIKEIEEENWNQKWESTIQAVEIGEKLTILPSWATYENKENRIIIKIDPKMSFGTGYHETTRLTLQLLEKYIRNGDSVLDIGTGTGVLAIAAIKLGGEHCLALDNDEWSIVNAKENVLENELTNRIRISDEPLSETLKIKYDIILANIMLTTIVELLHEITLHAKNGSKILFSGLLLQDENDFIKTIQKHKLKIIEKLTEGEWLAFAVEPDLTHE